MRALYLFGKRNRLRFVSHLDLQRFMHRAFNRTTLPIAFSQGFNPHPIMSFASALAMGWTSEYEILDIKFSRDVKKSFALQQMRAALPPDLPVLDVRLVDDHHPKMMASLVAADYTITFPQEVLDSLQAAAEDFLAKDSVLAMRKTKSGEKQVDIRPMVLSLTFSDGAMHARLMLTESETVKPDLLIRTMTENFGIETPDFRVHRTCLLACQDGTLIPLLDMKG